MANAIVALTLETVSAGYAVLVFCSSRASCQTTADMVCAAMLPHWSCDEDAQERRKDVLSSLRSLPVGLDKVLKRTIPLGVAFHRAWLNPLYVPKADGGRCWINNRGKRYSG